MIKRSLQAWAALIKNKYAIRVAALHCRNNLFALARGFTGCLTTSPPDTVVYMHPTTSCCYNQRALPVSNSTIKGNGSNINYNLFHIRSVDVCNVCPMHYTITGIRGCKWRGIYCVHSVPCCWAAALMTPPCSQQPNTFDVMFFWKWTTTATSWRHKLHKK